MSSTGSAGQIVSERSQKPSHEKKRIGLQKSCLQRSHGSGQKPDSAGTGPHQSIENPTVEPTKHTRNLAGEPRGAVHRFVNAALVGAGGARRGPKDSAIQNLFLIKGVDVPAISEKIDNRAESPVERRAPVRDDQVIAPGKPDAARRDHA